MINLLEEVMQQVAELPEEWQVKLAQALVILLAYDAEQDRSLDD